LDIGALEKARDLIAEAGEAVRRRLSERDATTQLPV
jgi:hypothetical protein